MLVFERFHESILVKVKVKVTWVTKFNKVVKHCTQACSCIVLVFYIALGSSS